MQTYEQLTGESFITVATTRPETMLGDTAVAVNPKDPRAAALAGRKVRLPLVGRVIPIVADDYVVLPVSMGGDEKDPKAQFATGFLKVTPAHDPNDWEIGQRHNLAAVNIFAPDASISDKHGWSDIGQAGFLLGLDRLEARKAIVKHFEETGVLAERKPYRHSVPHSDRSKAMIEPYLSDQWYVKVTDDRLRGHALRAMAEDQTSRAREGAVIHEKRSAETSRACEEAALAEPRSHTADPRNRAQEEAQDETPSAETSRACQEAALAEHRSHTADHRNRAGASSTPPAQPALDFGPVATVPYPVYFLTWTTYCAWPHGDERGSVDRGHNELHTPHLPSDRPREHNAQARAKNDEVTLNAQQRQIVCVKIDEVCRHRGWAPLAVSVRGTHIHVVVSATSKEPEDVMTDFKAYATRGLIEAGTVAQGSKVWTRHGSTKWLNDAESVKAACRYVLLEQGWNEPGTVSGACWTGDCPTPLPDGRGSSGPGENEPGTVSGACWTGDRPTPLPDGRGSSGQALTGGEKDEKRSAETSRACEEAALAEQRSHTADSGNRAGAHGTQRDAPWQGQLRFHPDRYAKTFETWHENIRDWCISRQLWWGHRIPVWTSAPLEGSLVPGSMTEDEYIHGIEEFLAQLNTWQREGRLARRATVRWQEPPTHPDEPRQFDDVVVRSDSDCEIIQALQEHGYRQDPDVLDTWFSSALWPLSTMGWPDPESYDETRSRGGQPNLLDFFNPTSVLCTAREIITLWVSRMVMFNLYFTEDTEKGQRLPFRDVFIHAMIQDGEGRKMSKSLGNGVDPRDIIRSKGADAMRFTLVQMTTQTQDVRMPVEYDETIGANTSPKFELGRRLANKIWNATRFAIGILSGPTGETPVPPMVEPTRLIDRWMLSRLARTLAEVEASIRKYDFSVYAQQMYDLFWRDLCDWYLEGVKPTIREDATQQRVLRSALGAINRMFHPIMPFVTESLHASIEALPVEPLEEIELPSSDLAATARWPIMPDTFLDDAAEAQFARLQELVSIIREVRSVQKVHDRRMITLHVADDATMALIEQAQGVVEVLAGLGQVTRDDVGGEGVTFLFGNAEHLLADLTDAIDVAAERDRLTRQKAEMEKRITGLKGRLNNKGYIQKAPSKLVEETKQQLAESLSELDRIIQSLGKLDS